jgi:hypothetical protein
MLSFFPFFFPFLLFCTLVGLYSPSPLPYLLCMLKTRHIVSDYLDGLYIQLDGVAYGMEPTVYSASLLFLFSSIVLSKLYFSQSLSRLLFFYALTHVCARFFFKPKPASFSLSPLTHPTPSPHTH